MKWLITGGCGFIGGNLVEALLAEGGHGVRILDNLRTCGAAPLAGLPEPRRVAAEALGSLADGALELVEGDIREADVAARAAAGAEVIVHLAASTGVQPSVEAPREDCEANVRGTLNCLEAARMAGVRRFVFASSGAPVGEVEPPITEDIVPRPVSPYGASKLAGEAYCSAYYRTFGVETVALRFGNVYGPRSAHKSSVVARFVRDALAGGPLTIYGTGKQTRDFIHVADLLRAVRAAAIAPGAAGEIFQIATSRETTVGEIAELVAAALEAQGFARPAVRYAERRAGDVLRNYSDTSKARERLGWRAKVPLDRGLAETVRGLCAGAEEPRGAQPAEAR